MSQVAATATLELHSSSSAVHLSIPENNDDEKRGSADTNVGIMKWEEEQAAKQGMTVLQAHTARLEKKSRESNANNMRTYWVAVCMWLSIGDTVMQVWINEVTHCRCFCSVYMGPGTHSTQCRAALARNELC